MNPPMVYEVTNPRSQSTIKMIALVSSIFLLVMKTFGHLKPAVRDRTEPSGQQKAARLRAPLTAEQPAPRIRYLAASGPPEITISTRRLRARPSAVELSPIGMDKPRPVTSMLDAGTPCPMRKSRTVIA